MDNASVIETSIKNFILTQFLPEEDPEALDVNVPLISTGIMDSIAVLKLVLFLEEEFSITIDPHEATFEYMDTIDLIAKLVRSKG